MVLPELILLCNRFKIPLNELVEISDTNTVSFTTQFIESDAHSIKNFLLSVLNEIKSISQAGEGRTIFVIKDLNIFQLLQIPELAAFKFYFWQKSGLGSDELVSEPFSIAHLKHENKSIIDEIVGYYLKTNTWELMSSDVLVSAEKQIMYYYEMGFIKEKSDAILLLEKLTEMADHLSRQAEAKRKFACGFSDDISNGEYLLYYNDLVSVDNLILAEYDNQLISYNTNNLINLLKSTNSSFYNYNMKMVSNLIKRSELISGTGERTRNKVFRKIKDQLARSIAELI